VVAGVGSKEVGRSLESGSVLAVVDVDVVLIASVLFVVGLAPSVTWEG
jgi:hypothetical protein